MKTFTIVLNNEEEEEILIEGLVNAVHIVENRMTKCKYRNSTIGMSEAKSALAFLHKVMEGKALSEETEARTIADYGLAG